MLANPNLRWGISAVAVAVAVAAAMLVRPAASEAATTVGVDTSAPATASYGPCDTNTSVVCTYANLQHPPRQPTAPFDGVVVRWRVQSGGTAQVQIRIRVLRSLGGNVVTGAGTGSFETASNNVEGVFASRLPIQQGDLIGLDVQGGPGSPGVRLASVSGASVAFYKPAIADGGPGAPPFSTNSGVAYQFNADIEPDCDADGFGDESQDPEIPAIQACDPNPPDATITKQPKKKSKKRTVTFEFSSSEPGSTFECRFDDEAFAACTPPVSDKVKRGKHTFEVRARDAAGNVDATPATASFKVKKKP